eukprot:437607_1
MENTATEIYFKYIETFGSIPKKTKYLMNFANQINKPLSYKNAAAIIKHPPSANIDNHHQKQNESIKPNIKNISENSTKSSGADITTTTATSLPEFSIITVKNPHTGKTITWRKSDPVKVWSNSSNKWCPGEILNIVQDADGYCLDIYYWLNSQPKAKYLEPLTNTLRPISSDFTHRNEWTSGSKVECFSNSQKLWHEATVADIKKYPDVKEDFIKVQWY